MLKPLRLFIKRGNFAGFGSKAFASMFFLMAGVAAAGTREHLNWQASALLFGFCLAAVGDILLAIEPVLKDAERDKGFAFALGGAPFLLAHGLNLAVFLSKGAFDWRLLPLALLLPALCGALWACRIINFGKAGAAILLYALVLGATLWAAAQAAMADAKLGMLVLPAAALFAFSDTMLFLSYFGNRKTKPHRSMMWFVMFPYYLAQVLLACAVSLV